MDYKIGSEYYIRDKGYPEPPQRIRMNLMNLNYATLFPGLDGFARSLNTVLTLSDDIPWEEEVDFLI